MFFVVLLLHVGIQKQMRLNEKLQVTESKLKITFSFMSLGLRYKHKLYSFLV